MHRWPQIPEFFLLSSKPSTNLYLKIAYRTLENKPLKIEVPISERTPWIWAASPSHLLAKRKTTRTPPCVPFPSGTPQPHEGDMHGLLPPMPCSAWTSVIKLCCLTRTCGDLLGTETLSNCQETMSHIDVDIKSNANPSQIHPLTTLPRSRRPEGLGKKSAGQPGCPGTGKRPHSQNSPSFLKTSRS